MLTIRLRRIGKKGQPTFRVVIAEHTAPIQGKFIADLGFYNPHTKKVSLESKTVLDWLNKGARPSNTIAKLLESLKIKHASIVVVKRSKKAKKKTVEEKPVAAQAEVKEDGEVTAEISDQTDDLDQATEKIEAEASPEPEKESASS